MENAKCFKICISTISLAESTTNMVDLARGKLPRIFQKAVWEDLGVGVAAR